MENQEKPRRRVQNQTRGPGRARAQRHVPGEDVEAGPGPPGALLDEFAGAAGHVLVGADPGSTTTR